MSMQMWMQLSSSCSCPHFLQCLSALSTAQCSDCCHTLGSGSTSPTDSFSPLLQRNAHSFALNLAVLAPAALFPLSSHSHPHLLCPCHNSFISISLSEYAHEPISPQFWLLSTITRSIISLIFCHKIYLSIYPELSLSNLISTWE